eukprot:127677_1
MASSSLVCTNNIAVCISSIGVLCLIYIFLLPFMVVSTIKFYRIQHYGGISARYPTIIVATSIYTTLHLFIIDQYMLISQGIAPSLLQSPMMHWITTMIFPRFSLIIPFITVLRVWLIHFDIKHALHKSTQDWQILLGSTVDKEDWFSRNKSKWGNWKWLLKIFIFSWCILSVCTMIPSIVSYSNHAIRISQTLYIILLLLLLFPIGVIWYKTPYFEDTFYIKKEIQILLKCDIVCILLFFFMSFWARPSNIFELIQRVSIISIHFLQVYVSVHWVIIKQQTINKPAASAMNLMSSHNKSRLNQCCLLYRVDADFDRPFRMSIVNSRSNSVKQRLFTNQRLFNVLIATDIGINCLFEHLKREFCFESLLFFIEIVQWIYSVTNKSFDKWDIRPVPDIQFEFATVVPISCINNTDHGWHYKIDQIYNKYIGPSGEYQVNLPWTIQNEYSNLLRLFSIKCQIESGTYTPRLKRKTHLRTPHIKTKTFWNRHTSKSPKKTENTKDGLTLNSTKYQRSTTDENDSDLPTLPNTQLATSTQSCGTIHEDKTVKNVHKKNDTVATVDLGAIRHNSHKHVHYESSQSHNTSKKRRIQSLISPLMYERTGTLIEQESVPVDTDSEDDDGSIIMEINLHKGISGGKSWKNPSIEYSYEFDGSGSNDDSDQTHKHKQDWDTTDLVLMELDEKQGDRSDIVSDEAETPIPLETTVMTQGHSDTQNLDDICQDVLLAPAATIEYDKSASKTVTFESNPSSKGAAPADINKIDKAASIAVQSSDTHALNNIFQDVLGQASVTTIDMYKKGTSGLSVDIDVVELKEEEEEEHKHEDQTLAVPLPSHSPEMGIQTSFSRSKNRNVLKKLTALIPIAFSPSALMEMDENDEYEIDEAEQKQMEQAKRITVHDFVSVSSRAMYEILKLNYHSVARFKRSIHFKTFEESVNLNELLNQFGDKGC